MKRLFFSAFLLFVALGANAQEFVKAVDDSVTERFVRRINDTSWLYYGNGNRVSTLTRMTASGSAFPSIVVNDLLTVYDMEVADNMMYYSGIVRRNNSKKNAFGFLDLSNFPSGDVSCFPTDETVYRVLPVPGQYLFQLYVAGRDSYGAGRCLIEASYVPPQQIWTFNKYVIEEQNYEIDDMAATTNYVVFTVRDASNHEGYMFCLPRVTGPVGPTARTTYINMQKVTSTAYSPLLVEAATGDTVYIVHSNNSVNGAVAVHKYHAMGTHAASRMLGGAVLKQFAMTVKDITYDNQYKVLHVLTDVMQSSARSHIIWHIWNSQMSTGYTVSGHKYAAHTLQSLDHMQGGSRNTIAAGYDSMDFNSRIYRMKDNVWGSCSGSESLPFTQLDEVDEPLWITFRPEYVEYNQYTLPKTTGTTEVSTICE